MPISPYIGLETMKQYIVLIALITLGVFLYGVIAGPGDESLTRISGKVLYEAACESAGL